MNLDRELKSALRPKSPPSGFAGRVLRRLQEERTPRQVGSIPLWRAVAAALTMTAILGGLAAREAVQQRAEEERLRREVLTALRITSDKLRAVQQQVQQIGSRDE